MPSRITAAERRDFNYTMVLPDGLLWLLDQVPASSRVTETLLHDGPSRVSEHPRYEHIADTIVQWRGLFASSVITHVSRALRADQRLPLTHEVPT